LSYQYTFYILRVELISSSSDDDDDDDKDDEQQDIITRNNKRQQTVKKVYIEKRCNTSHHTTHNFVSRLYVMLLLGLHIANNNGNLLFI